MKENLKVIVGTVAVVALVAAVGILATEPFDDDDDQLAQAVATVPVDADDVAQHDDAQVVEADDVPLTKSEFNRAEAAAVRIAGGGVVTDVDRSDDIDEAYEVEVVSDAGEIDIALNDRFERVPNLRYDD